ncbi:MAG: transcriptional regulator, Crp/Fnr family [Myxococcales bacterium]|nr:transcriptional regulator, Crp/Fnr family [Myxococcales bacterium]
MAIATASLDLDRYGRTPKVAPQSPELEALQACPVLGSVPATVLETLGRGSVLRNVTRGAIIASEGALVPHVLVIVRGRVRAVRRASSGREVTVEVFRQGDLVADATLAPETPLANDWEAAEATTILLIPRDVFRSVANAAPELAVGLAAQLLRRLDRSKDLAVALALSDVESRVVTALVNLGRMDGVDGAEGLLIRHRPTQQEIANQIGACRETVSRTVSDLVRRGLVAPRGKSLLLTRSLCERAA